MPLINEQTLQKEINVRRKAFVNQINTSMFSGKYSKLIEEFKNKSKTGDLGLRLELLTNCKKFGKVALATKTFYEKNTFPNTVLKKRDDYIALNKKLQNSPDIGVFLTELFGHPNDVYDDNLIPEMHEAALFFYITSEEHFQKFIDNKIIPMDLSFENILDLTLYNFLFLKMNEEIDSKLNSSIVPIISSTYVTKLDDQKLSDVFFDFRETYQKFSYLFNIQSEGEHRIDMDNKKYFVPVKSNGNMCVDPSNRNEAEKAIGEAIYFYGTFALRTQLIPAPFDLDV